MKLLIFFLLVLFPFTHVTAQAARVNELQEGYYEANGPFGLVSVRFIEGNTFKVETCARYGTGCKPVTAVVTKIEEHEKFVRYRSIEASMEVFYEGQLCMLPYKLSLFAKPDGSIVLLSKDPSRIPFYAPNGLCPAPETLRYQVVFGNIQKLLAY